MFHLFIVQQKTLGVNTQGLCVDLQINYLIFQLGDTTNGFKVTHLA